jgi:cation:H+ antiporter
MSVLVAALVLAVGVALLIWGGDVLVRGAVVLANHLGVPPLLVGLTVVAFGTSAPELALNLVAAVRGNDGLSFGNIVGSNIANVGLILGLSALVKPLHVSSSVVRRELPLMLGATFLLLGMVGIPTGDPMWRAPDGAPPIGVIDTPEGVVLLGVFALTMLLIFRAGLKNRAVREKFEDEAAEIGAAKEPGLPGAIVRLIIGLAALLLGGWLAEGGASSIARSLGMSDELIGLTVVAVATSLPELATSIQAIRQGNVDIAVGNVVGSNIFNILLVLGATAMVGSIDIPADGLISLGVMAALSLLLVPMSMVRGSVVSRMEGVVLLAIYAAFMGWSVWAAAAPTLTPPDDAEHTTPPPAATPEADQGPSPPAEHDADLPALPDLLPGEDLPRAQPDTAPDD